MPPDLKDLRRGTTRLNLPTLETPGRPADRFLEAVREAAAGEFEILGELGRRPDGSIAYLARDLAELRLVALRLVRAPGTDYQYSLDVLRELDSSLPAGGTGCPRCSEPLRGWGRFCHRCGGDLSGATTSSEGMSGADLLEAVRQAARNRYEIIGEMGRAEGGGMVYFARERGQDQIVGLRLQKESPREYALGVTSSMPALDRSTPAVPLSTRDDPDATMAYGGEPPPAGAPAEEVPRPAWRRPVVLALAAVVVVTVLAVVVLVL